jgi:hypothetical protein
MIFFVPCIRNSRKNKNRQPIRAAVFTPPAEILFGEFPHHTSSGTFVPDQGHLSSPLPGCQTCLRVIPDVASDRTQPVSACNKNLCHSRLQTALVAVVRFTKRLAVRPGSGIKSRTFSGISERKNSRTRGCSSDSKLTAYNI